MNKKKIITPALVVTVMHFLLTSLISHYIAVQIGTQMGQVVASGLTEASEQNSAESREEAERIYQDMQNKRNDIIQKWKIPAVIISLPAKPLINLLLEQIRRNQINKVITKEISRDQFRTQGLLIDYTANFINSLAFGLLLYLILRITNQKITKGFT